MGVRDRRRPFLGEINTAPFVDVMLVLLVIFMVTAAVKNRGVDVELPRTRTVESLPAGTGHVVLTMRADGAIFLDMLEVDRESLTDHLIQRVVKLDKRLFLRADKAVSHGDVVEVLGEIKGVGITGVGIVAEPEEE